MNWIRGYYRLTLAGLALGFGGTLLVIASWLPIRVGEHHLALWMLPRIVRLILFILNVKVECPQPEKFRQHRGFVFPNHVSYVDVLTLVSVAPLRFLAKAEVRSWPIVGTIATAIGCVFVQREDKKSRAEARNALAKVETFPAVALFPEGKRGPGNELLPFRYGAFEIVIKGQAAFLPCAIIYDQPEVAIWRRGEHFLKALWRLCSFRGPLVARLVALDAVQPAPDDDPAHLAQKTQADIAAVIEQHRSQSEAN